VNVFKQIDAEGDKALSRDEISAYLKQQVPGLYPHIKGKITRSWK
jgi:hypothetical protein